jgi:hypothetical protein
MVVLAKVGRSPMEEEQIREALNAHWHASAIGDVNAEHDIYDDDAICDYPQSGERILGRSNLQALRSHHPGKPSGFQGIFYRAVELPRSSQNQA